MTPKVFRHLLEKVCAAGYMQEVEWARNIETCESVDDLAWEYIWVVCNSGMKNTVAEMIFRDRVRPALLNGQPVIKFFKHANKAKAIENAWQDRRKLFKAYQQKRAEGNDAVLEWCGSLFMIGAITKFHLAKNLGVDVAKPDVWLQRVADDTGETVEDLCQRLAQDTGERVAVVDTVIWRACERGLYSPSRKSKAVVARC